MLILLLECAEWGIPMRRGRVGGLLMVLAINNFFYLRFIIFLYFYVGIFSHYIFIFLHLSVGPRPGVSSPRLWLIKALRQPPTPTEGANSLDKFQTRNLQGRKIKSLFIGIVFIYFTHLLKTLIYSL